VAVIVQLVENLEVGGLERMAVDLALAHRAAGHRVSMYCLYGAGPLARDLEREGVPVVEFHKERRSRAGVVWSMSRQLRRDRADVIHGHNSGVHHFAATAKRIAGTPVCLNTRHSATSSTGEPYQEKYFRWVEPFTEQVVFVCDLVRQQLAPLLNYPPAKCSVILNGIPLEKFLARPASPGSMRPRIRFGTVGRLVPAKGHAVLIDAFAKVAAELPEADLKIYGYGPLEGELQARIERLGMRGRITLAGRTEDTSRVLEALDIFVFSSLNEGLPLVILEAMAAGLPVVSTRVGGVPEVAPERLFPWMCEPGDADALAKAMSCAAANTQLAAIGQAGRDLAARSYGVGEMASNYLALYEKLSGRKLPISV
jgi:glycosyltransferase involved in cell wall biosynthesis